MALLLSPTFITHHGASQDPLLVKNHSPVFRKVLGGNIERSSVLTHFEVDPMRVYEGLSNGRSSDGYYLPWSWLAAAWRLSNSPPGSKICFFASLPNTIHLLNGQQLGYNTAHIARGGQLVKPTGAGFLCNRHFKPEAIVKALRPVQYP